MAENLLAKYGTVQAAPRNNLLGLIADALGKADAYANKPSTTMPGGVANPPLSAVANLLGVGAIARTADSASYGYPITQGSGWATRIPDDTRDAALAVAPMAGAVNKLAGPASQGLARAAAVAMENAAAPRMAGPMSGQRGMLLYHGTDFNKPIREASRHEAGVIDGMFTSPSKAAAGSHGEALYRFTVPDERIAPQNLADFTDLPAVKNVLSDRVTGPHREAIIDAILADKDLAMGYGGPLFSDDVLSRALPQARGWADAGDLSWEAQNIRGHVAKAAGFDAVPMRDEHGTSYLIAPGGPKPRPYNDAAKRRFNPEKYPAEPPPVPQPYVAPQKSEIPADILEKTKNIAGARQRQMEIARLMAQRGGR